MSPFYQLVGLVVCVGAFITVVKVIASAVLRLNAQNREHAGAGASHELLSSRLDRIEAAVDAVALEVERIGEMQRFSDRLATGAPADDSGDVRLPSRAAASRELGAGRR